MERRELTYSDPQEVPGKIIRRIYYGNFDNLRRLFIVSRQGWSGPPSDVSDVLSAVPMSRDAHY